MEKSNKKSQYYIEKFIEKGFLISPDIIKKKNWDNSFENILIKLSKKKDLLVFSNYVDKFLIKENINNFNWLEMEKSKALYEKQKKKDIYTNFLDFLNNQHEKSLLVEKEKIPEDISYINKYTESIKKRDIQDFINIFNERYNNIKRILLNRRELQGVNSISRLQNKSDRQSVAIIGMVTSKRLTKNKHLMLRLEDPTGEINVLINKNRSDLSSIGQDIVLDEIMGITGTSGRNIIFADNVLFPDLPSYSELKRSPEESYLLILSDLHVGSGNFMKEEFNRFLKWINGKVGNKDQKELASKITHIIILGDLVEGVGIYPGQEKELEIVDIVDQYKNCAELLAKIPKNIKLLIIPGNHDAVRLAEPQPPLFKDLAKPIWELPNAINLGNPAFINIMSTDKFPGFDLLLYHGYSFIYYAENVDSIRQKGGLDRVDLIMKFLLQKRHLAPTHSSNMYIPHTDNDPLLISKSPDFFLTGHLHKCIAANYKNTTMISGSCWESDTSYMKKMGVKGEPARVPIVNLKTRKVKILRFEK
ncbi:MAG: DNA polymerase II small subunit [Candidatus Woesearchaeota archaeon]|nr:DNA polymerase II small subunit [Candidatus Woesearchaeota archaeon]